MNKAIFKGCHPSYGNHDYSHYLFFMYRGERYGLNTLNGKVYHHGVNDKGSYTKETKTKHIVNAIKLTFKELENN